MDPAFAEFLSSLSIRDQTFYVLMRSYENDCRSNIYDLVSPVRNLYQTLISNILDLEFSSLNTRPQDLPSPDHKPQDLPSLDDKPEDSFDHKKKRCLLDEFEDALGPWYSSSSSSSS